MICKKILILIIFVSALQSSTKDDIIELYYQKKYALACKKAGELYSKYSSDEDFLSLYADACIQTDMINRTILPIIKLHKTPKSRENAVYFATILYQKKLLYYALVDDVDISYINLPKTKYILSIIFDKFINGNYDYKDGAYWFNDDIDENIRYKLSVETHQKVKKLFLRTYKSDKMIKVRTYW